MKRFWSISLALAPGLATAGLWLFAPSAVRSQAEPAGYYAAPTAYPDRIVLSPGADPAAAVGVNWRTSASVNTGSVEIAEADPSPSFPRSARRLPARSEKISTDQGSACFHSAFISGLKPGVVYAYRVGEGERWSEWFQFRTALAEPAPFSFIYFGDAQNNLRSMWSRVIRDAFRQEAGARFIIHAGDLVNRGARDAEWGEWFGAGGWMNGMVLNAPTPGNHEYPGSLTPLWKPQFTLPRNGPESLSETVYFFDYQGVRIISLNSNEQTQQQVDWLDAALKKNPHRWSIVTFHHPLLSAAKGRDNAALRAAWKPVLDRHRVDLVLQGHDHTYARSNLMLGKNAREPGGTVYVVSVSGPKMYAVAKQDWMKRVAEQTQLYQIIRVDGDRLQYEARTATGSLYDAFELRKRDGAPNQLLERSDAVSRARIRVSPASRR